MSPLTQAPIRAKLTCQINPVLYGARQTGYVRPGPGHWGLEPDRSELSLEGVWIEQRVRHPHHTDLPAARELASGRAPGKVKGMINVSLNAAGSIISIVRNNGPIIVTGTRNLHAAPSIITFDGRKRQLIKRLTHHRAILGPRGAFCNVGHCVNHGCGRLSTTSGQIPCAVHHSRINDVGVHYPHLRGSFTPRRLSTVVLQGLTSRTDHCLNRPIAKTIVAIPTCFGSARHRTAHGTKHVTKLSIRHVLGRPATTTLTCNLSRACGRAILIFSLNNNAFSMSVLSIKSNIFRIQSASNSARLNNASFSRGVIS